MSKELTVVGQNQYPILALDEGVVKTALGQITEMGLNVFDLNMLRVPSQGKEQWEVHGNDGKPTLQDEVRGVIIAMHNTRSYWSAGLDQGGGEAPPDCTSNDGITGTGNPGGPCHECKFSKWGSDLNQDGTPGKGQACKLQLHVYLMPSNQERRLPTLVIFPPTSLRSSRSFMANLIDTGMDLHSTEVVLTLKQYPNPFKHSRIQLALGERLTPNQIEAVKSYADSFNKFLAAQHNGS
jgi:hypothetical protein